MKLEKSCGECGCKYLVKPSLIEKSKFCSKACKVKCPEHPFIVKDDAGVIKLSSNIEVHHIDRVRSNNELSNLLAVTKWAHSQIHHHNRKPEPWECWSSNPTIR